MSSSTHNFVVASTADEKKVSLALRGSDKLLGDVNLHVFVLKYLADLIDIN